MDEHRTQNSRRKLNTRSQTAFSAFRGALALFALSGIVSAWGDNLQTCLDGRYPSLCNKSALSPEQLRRTLEAEHRANLSTCLEGKYPTLCRHGDLSVSESSDVRRAEHAANLASCLEGKYPTPCRHGDLTAAESAQVQIAEHRETLATCLDGRYPSLCRHGDLSPEEARRVATAELQHPHTAPPQQSHHSLSHSTRVARSTCESGHWIDSVMDDGSIIKLEDGSLWQVDGADTVDSALWLPTTDIVACDGKLINTEDNETVEAERIK